MIFPILQNIGLIVNYRMTCATNDLAFILLKPWKVILTFYNVKRNDLFKKLNVIVDYPHTLKSLDWKLTPAISFSGYCRKAYTREYLSKRVSMKFVLDMHTAPWKYWKTAEWAGLQGSKFSREQCKHLCALCLFPPRSKATPHP